MTITEVRIIMLILAAAFAVVQLTWLSIYINRKSNPVWTAVKVGILPGIIAIALAIAAVLV